jgi:hypothetical protein
VTALVADFDADHPQPAFAEGAGLRALHLDLDRRRLTRLDRSQLPYAQVAVAARDAVEEIADGVDTGFRGGFGELGTDAFQST